MLDYRIESFLMVCRTMSITRAAEALHIHTARCFPAHQSAGKQYGAALFSYRGKKLALTQAGRMLCQAARTMRQDAAQLQKRIASLGGEQPVLRFWRYAHRGRIRDAAGIGALSKAAPGCADLHARGGYRAAAPRPG